MLQPPGTIRMYEISLRLLPESNADHLHQTAFHFAMEVGVLLDPVDDDDPVSTGRVLIQVNRQALVSRPDLNDVHRGANRAADKCLGYPERSEDFHLAFGRRSPMASHRRHDKRLAAHPMYRLGHPAHDAGNVGNPSATHGD